MVCVCKKRLVAANLLFDRGVDVILSDDGLQHYTLGRDIEFAVVSSNRGFGNRYLLPAGPLRERIERLDSLDLLLINGKQIDQDLNMKNIISYLKLFLMVIFRKFFLVKNLKFLRKIL